MADLRTRYLEDYAGGLLNIARQEISSTGEVLAQDGFVDDLTLFVEDGRGVKSGLRLGSSLAECIDPTTETGVLNVRTADRTYAQIRDLKVFSTAVASAQAALSESVSGSIINLEQAFESLENDVQVYKDRSDQSVETVSQSVSALTTRVSTLEGDNSSTSLSLESVIARVDSVEQTILSSGVTKVELTSSVSSPVIDEQSTSDLEIDAWNFYTLLYVSTDVPAWVSFYTSANVRANDDRISPETNGIGVIADVVTGEGDLTRIFAPAIIGYSDTKSVKIRVRNLSTLSSRVGVTMRYVKL